MATRPSFYVLDAFNLIFQVFHAIPEMTGPAGQPTQAVFGIFRDLLNLVRDRKPDYLAAAFDGPGRVFRSEIYRGVQGEPQGNARRPGAADPGDPPGLRRAFGSRCSWSRRWRPTT